MAKLLSNWSAFFYQLATRRNTLLALAGQVLFSLIIFPAAELRYDITGNIGVPDLQFGLTPDRLYEIFEAYGPDGRRFYFWAEIFADGIYPLVYNAFSILLLSLVLKRLQVENSGWRLLNLWPLLTLLFDYLENFFILKVLIRFPEHNDTAAQFASLAQCGKWVSLGCGILILLGAISLLKIRAN